MLLAAGILFNNFKLISEVANELQIMLLSHSPDVAFLVIVPALQVVFDGLLDEYLKVLLLNRAIVADLGEGPLQGHRSIQSFWSHERNTASLFVSFHIRKVGLVKFTESLLVVQPQKHVKVHRDVILNRVDDDALFVPAEEGPESIEK